MLLPSQQERKMLSKKPALAVCSWEIEEIVKDRSFHGSIKGEEAEQRLGRASVDCYLTRYSETRSKQENRSVYVISVVRDINGERKFRHFDLIIGRNDVRYTTYEIDGSEKKMNHLRDLLKFYKDTAVDRQFSGIGECFTTDETIFEEVKTIQSNLPYLGSSTLRGAHNKKMAARYK